MYSQDKPISRNQNFQMTLGSLEKLLGAVCMDALKNIICPPRPATACALRIQSHVSVCRSCRDRLGWWWVVERAKSPLPRLCRRGGTEPWEGACMEQSLLASPDGFCSLGAQWELWSPPCWSSLGQHRGQLGLQKPLGWPLHGVNLPDLQIHFKIKEDKLLASFGANCVRQMLPTPAAFRGLWGDSCCGFTSLWGHPKRRAPWGHQSEIQEFETNIQTSPRACCSGAAGLRVSPPAAESSAELTASDSWRKTAFQPLNWAYLPWTQWRLMT